MSGLRRAAHGCGVQTGDKKFARESANASRLNVAAAPTTMGAAKKNRRAIGSPNRFGRRLSCQRIGRERTECGERQHRRDADEPRSPD